MDYLEKMKTYLNPVRAAKRYADFWMDWFKSNDRLDKIACAGSFIVMTLGPVALAYVLCKPPV